MPITNDTEHFFGFHLLFFHILNGQVTSFEGESFHEHLMARWKQQTDV